MGTRSGDHPRSASDRLIRFGRLEVKREFRIKRETPDDEIKEYAETAMNELLGWYGYDKVDSRDTKGLNLHHFAATRMFSGRRSPSDADSSDVEGPRSGSSPGRRDCSSQGSPPVPDSAPVPTGCIVCSWCNKIASHKMFSLKTSAGQKSFCSELCFTQCRRANFKRNKTCDWCRHIRHTVNYVDFQDGEHQLQFCSDKCLNQYKMNIFCKETEAHLQLHPHLQESGNGGGANGDASLGLITPELWLRDCRSESPVSDGSASPPDAKASLRSSGEASRNQIKSAPASLDAARTDRKEDCRKEKVRKNNFLARNKRQNRTLTQTAASDHGGSSSSPRSGESVSPPKAPVFPPPLLPLNGSPASHVHRGLPPDHPLSRPPFVPLPYLPPQMFPPDHPIHRNSPRYPHVLRPPLISPPSPSVNPPQQQQQQQPPPPPPPPPMTPLPPPPRSLLPPVTVLVPYPVALPIPLPLPIPIPIPIPAAPKKNETKDDDGRESRSAGKEPEPETAPVPREKLNEEESRVPVSPSVPRPLRKRKRIADTTQDDESATKRKTVPA